MTTAPRASDAPIRYEALDSFRGICASMIVLFHFTTNGMISRSNLINHSFLFVDFFFVLSGFVITASYRDRLAGGFPIARFMGLRLGRIYPLHVAVLLAFLAFEVFFAVAMPGTADRKPFSDNYSLGNFVAELLLVQPFVGPDGAPWNMPSWSIAVEWWTYLLFAAAFRWLGRALVPLTLLSSACCCWYLLHLTDRYIDVFHDGAFARCVYGFSLGVIAQRLFANRPAGFRPTRSMATAAEVLVMLMTVAMIYMIGITPASLAVPPVFVLVILVFAYQAGWVSRFLLLPPFLLGGTLSYSIYMTHLFLEYRVVNVLALVEKLIHHRVELVVQSGGHTHVGGSALFGDIMSVAMLLLVIAVASLTYRFVEKPGQRWSRRLILGDAPRRATLASERGRVDDQRMNRTVANP